MKPSAVIDYVLILIITALCVAVLTGCSSPTLRDGAIGTLPVPDPATDCQIRHGTYQIDGGGLFASGGVHQTITTVIGAANCPQGMSAPVVVPRSLDVRPRRTLRDDIREIVREEIAQ